MHPFAAAGKRMSRRSAKYPCQRHERNEQRAVGNAGSYAVRHCRAVRGSGSGSYRRVPEPVIARHPRGTWKRQQGETYKRFDTEPFYTAVVIGQGKSKNHWFLAAFFSIFLSLLKEIWPPEAYMQDAGAARNRRTENGPSGTPAPTGCATGDMTRYVWAGCAHWGVQTRDAGAGGVFRRTVIDRCGPSGRRI